MASGSSNDDGAGGVINPLTSFLGTGWSFPPEFNPVPGEVRMLAAEDDIESSLRLLFSTATGERLFNPKYGLDMRGVLFEPMSTTLRTLLEERVKIAILFYEPRINPLALSVDSPDPGSGTLLITLDYEVRATNSRFNLVFPFYLSGGNEVSTTVGIPGP
jgi:phage baseplate assembly protein W